MRSETNTFGFLFDVLQKNGPAVVGGGLAVLAFGYLLGRPLMMIIGALVAVIGVGDIVIRLLGLRRSD